MNEAVLLALIPTRGLGSGHCPPKSPLAGCWFAVSVESRHLHPSTSSLFPITVCCRRYHKRSRALYVSWVPGPQTCLSCHLEDLLPSEKQNFPSLLLSPCICGLLSKTRSHTAVFKFSYATLHGLRGSAKNKHRVEDG